MMKEHIYAAIDLKSFFASVECRENDLDPLTTHLVVADASRSAKTICLAVTPSLKAYGISSRARLFEVIQQVKKINQERIKKAPRYMFTGKSFRAEKLNKDPSLELDYIIAPPHMAKYIEYSKRIYQIYLKYVSSQDIHVYSIDEVFIDITHYLSIYQCNGYQLVKRIIQDIYEETGITATAGLGTNLYLAKVAMDIRAKHILPGPDGERIAYLNELTYRQYLWKHQPLTDFWRVGRGYASKLASINIYTMEDIARCSLENEDMLYQLFGVNAELLIDHAWGYEPCTIQDIKSYQPMSKSIGSGQVLHHPYSYEKAKLIVKEMMDLLALKMVEKNIVGKKLVLTIGYDKDNQNYTGEVKKDFYGRKIPKHAHGTIDLPQMTASSKLMMEAIVTLFERIVDASLLIRRINITVCHLDYYQEDLHHYVQYHLFEDLSLQEQKYQTMQQSLKEERKLQQAMITIKNKYGKNAILKGMNLQEGATTKDRNNQIGGHKA